MERIFMIIIYSVVFLVWIFWVLKTWKKSNIKQKLGSFLIIIGITMMTKYLISIPPVKIGAIAGGYVELLGFILHFIGNRDANK